MTSPNETPTPLNEETQKCADNQRDVALMLRVKSGDIAAFEELVEIYQGPVIGTVGKMLGGYSDAEDIAQQVFVRVWKSAERYQPKAKFTTWLFTITRNLVFNETRRRRRKPTVSVDEREEESPQIVEDVQTVSPDQKVLQAELEASVNKAIRELPEKQRMAVVLRRYEEMPYDEIGRILSMSVPAVKSLLFRARTQLKDSLKNYLDG